MQFIFLGPPGAGKGTQAQKLADFCQVPHISTGDILRQAVAAGTELGKKAQGYMTRGELVPEEVMLDLVRERLQMTDARAGWILDGFPRTVSQAEFLEELLLQMEKSCDGAINLDVPDEVIVDRLLGRGRADDTEDTIRRRLSVYREQTEPTIEFYRQRQCLRVVDGNRPVEEVREILRNLLPLS
ncbi:adenylate kinase [Oscillatoriales cyanobacterium LEGE 11467]|uniref:Adenylate kinase n=1 Tax=Zarconia navalis LEGE 11467 TaxID=1828826 RepID=A0A928W365_9CYAN|nr:adenylate kinase [Zarconia navalis]MBE9042360.1 adenylate kinase [Zarconia navalis LEGE 11467]